MENNILRMQGVVKSYGDFKAVDHVTFDIPKGVIFGMLGPNGAGKTSLIRIITNITKADAGQIWLDGEPLNSRHPEQIGYMPEERGLYKKMKVGEQLTYLARLKGLSAAQARQELGYWFKRFDIASWWDKKVDELSKGMQQKVQFIATVLHKPKLLILDEPFSGLDPINANLIESEIRELAQKGTSIIFSTHRMEQVEELCDHIVLINKGRNVLEGRVGEVKQRFKENLFRIEYGSELPNEVEAAHSIFSIKKNEEQALTVQLAEGASTNDVLRYLIHQGVEVRSFNELLPSINDIFIRRVGETVGS
ncbi:MAG: ATP-binding cassette domain-containing protein [Saprospiraceae bacterium]|nr:ATP-binding cassette domain-containing protein [Saprospiraceae bacterium]